MEHSRKSNRFTPEDITQLAADEIFVFGSNLAGRHSGGAALYAKEHFGAEEGIGEGRTGQCYAFPTLTRDFKQRDHHDLKSSISKFFNYAIDHSELIFLLTPVGCGIAGYSPYYMASLFRDAPKNVVLPKDFHNA